MKTKNTKPKGFLTAVVAAMVLIIGSLFLLQSNVMLSTAEAQSSLKIVYTSSRDGNDEIYVMNEDGTAQTRLTNNSNRDFQPAGSPDGSKIAFSSYRNNNFDIYVMDADGSNQTRITFDAANDIEPAWSPDGSQIAFVTSRDGKSEIYVMNADGTNQTNLTNSPSSYDTSHAWSPDGSQIAFTSNRTASNYDIFVMNADGTNPTMIISNQFYDSFPTWSPDGSQIAFIYFGDVYVANADGTNQVQITSDTPQQDQTGDAAWSPDGSKIAFSASSMGNWNLTVSVVEPDGSNRTALTTSNADEDPSWLPSVLPPDADGDGILDASDNCPAIPNALQSDIDAQDGGDVCDACPNDATDSCLASDAKEIGTAGGVLSAGSATLTIPAGSLSADTTLFIEDTGQFVGDFASSFLQGPMTSAHTLGTAGTTFAPPAILCFTFDPFGFTCSDDQFDMGEDSNSDGTYETSLPGETCTDIVPGSSMELCAEVSSLSDFAVFFTGAGSLEENVQLSADFSTSQDYVLEGKNTFSYKRGTPSDPPDTVVLTAGSEFSLSDNTCGKALASGTFLSTITKEAQSTPPASKSTMCAKHTSTKNLLEIQNIAYAAPVGDSRTMTFDVVGPDKDSDGVSNITDQCPTLVGTVVGCPAGLRVSVQEVDVSTRPAPFGDTALTTKVFPAGIGSCADATGIQPINYENIFNTCTDVENEQNETNSPGNLVAELETIGATTGDKLVLVRSQLGTDGYAYMGFDVPALAAGESRDLGFNIAPAESETFKSNAYFTKDSRGKWHSSRAQTVHGSILNIIYPGYSLWNGTEELYPFVFDSDSDWTVDVCLEVPNGYVVAEPGDCSQTFVNNETKVLEFRAVDLASPPPHAKAKIKVKHKGKTHKLDLDIPGKRKGKDKNKADLSEFLAAQVDSEIEDVLSAEADKALDRNTILLILLALVVVGGVAYGVGKASQK